MNFPPKSRLCLFIHSLNYAGILTEYHRHISTGWGGMKMTSLPWLRRSRPPAVGLFVVFPLLSHPHPIPFTPIPCEGREAIQRPPYHTHRPSRPWPWPSHHSSFCFIPSHLYLSQHLCHLQAWSGVPVLEHMATSCSFLNCYPHRSGLLSLTGHFLSSASSHLSSFHRLLNSIFAKLLPLASFILPILLFNAGLKEQVLISTLIN